MKRLFPIFMVLGGLMMVAGFGLPAERVVRAVLPASKPEFFQKLLEGMCWLKAALVINGLALIAFRWLKRWLWDATPALPAQPRRSFFAGKSPAWDQRDVSIMLGLGLLALSLRLIGSQQSLFGDEIGVQLRYLSRGLPVIFTFYSPGTPQHVMYSVLAYFCERLPLPLEIAYRLPAILFGAGAVVLTYVVARRAFHRLGATLIGILNAVALYGIVYSHNAKGYSATHFFVVLAILAMIWIADNWRKARGWLCLGGATGGMLWMHLYNVYLCAGIGIAFLLVSVWLTASQWELTRAWWGRATLVFGAVGLWLLLLYALQIPQVLDLFGQVTDKPEEQISFTSVRGWLMQLTFWGTAWPVAIACAVLAVSGMVSLFRREPRLALLLAFPAMFVWGMILLKGTWIYPRYLVFTLPSFLIFLVEAGRRLGGRFAPGTMTVVAMLFLVPTLNIGMEYYQAGNQNIRAATQLAGTIAQPQDKLVAYGLVRDLIPFYDDRFRVVATLTELDALRADTTGRVIVVYGWRKAWHNREADFQRFDEQYDLVGRFPGFLMDSTERDGEMVVVASRPAS